MAAHVQHLHDQQAAASAPQFGEDRHGNQVCTSTSTIRNIVADSFGGCVAQYLCLECGNNDQNEFIDEHSGGDVVCTCCGIVIAQRKAHEGQAYRNFKDEVLIVFYTANSNSIFFNC